MLLAVFLFWVKMYVVYKFIFAIAAENTVQELILLFSSLSSLLFIFGIALFTKGKMYTHTVLCSAVSLTILLCSNIMFYGFFDDYLTVPVLLQTSNFSDLGSSIRELLSYRTGLLFMDIIVLWYVARKWPQIIPKDKLSIKSRSVYFVGLITLFIVHLSFAEKERPQLLTRSFDRKILVKNIGLFNYHVYDVILQSKSSAQRALADSDKLIEVENFVGGKRKPKHDLFGIAKGKNVIIISMESLQQFVINNTVNGQVITPFLNELIQKSYYFNEFYHQTGQGKTSDAEFIIDNSLYPLDRGAVFFTHAGNQYVATPAILRHYGYYSAVFHANNKSFWNRNLMYPALGYHRYFHGQHFAANATNSVGWGLKDREMFEQSIQQLKSLPRPFYVKYITLTNHFPFRLGVKDQIIPPYDSTSSTLNRYFSTVRYSDEAVRYFFTRLQEEGLYEDTIFVLYGDHYGISENHNKALAQYLGKGEFTPADVVLLQKVPLIIHIPGQKAKVMSQVGGQIDVKPTLLHLLGVERERDIHFGEDFFSPLKEQFTVFRDGSFVTEHYIYTRGVCYNRNGEVLDVTHCLPYIKKARLELRYSDKLIYGDLLRFLNNR
ncbi:LTA synthase family protein [Ectobacillus sp. JY-23]|uniref:LTA synthase family protein n=1 Tax=Ectobacillus sp. JY-23 TaxID=2933872 RepID=UPI001FF3FAD1|nr:LTA synthase family protein [Ectobacillus sp. JY-23]UOY94495.1 LTA synthase family protein [Ectobacillus sp. JY-23]